MAVVNELDHIIQFLEAHGTRMHDIALALGLEYDYIKAQKTQKDRQKQSKRLVEKVRTRYADELIKLPPFVIQYDTNDALHLLNEKDLGLTEESQERKELAIESNEILHILLKKVTKTERKQSKQNKYIAKRDSNGNEQLEKEILAQLEEETDSQEINEETEKDNSRQDNKDNAV